MDPLGKGKGKGSGVWPSMVTHTQNLCSAFNPSKCTHTVVNIHPEQWVANSVAPGEQLGIRCLAQGSHLSRGIEGGESTGYSLPPPTIPAGPETWTHDLRVTSPTLYPLGHDCPLGTNMYLLKRYHPSDSYCTFISESVPYSPVVSCLTNVLFCLV